LKFTCSNEKGTVASSTYGKRRLCRRPSIIFIIIIIAWRSRFPIHEHIQYSQVHVEISIRMIGQFDVKGGNAMLRSPTNQCAGVLAASVNGRIRIRAYRGDSLSQAVTKGSAGGLPCFIEHPAPTVLRKTMTKNQNPSARTARRRLGGVLCTRGGDCQSEISCAHRRRLSRPIFVAQRRALRGCPP